MIRLRRNKYAKVEERVEDTVNVHTILIIKPGGKRSIRYIVGRILEIMNK
jgi:hypothetical protein